MPTALCGRGSHNNHTSCCKAAVSCTRTHLRVLVDEHKGVGHVMVAKMDDAAPHPALHAALCVVQDLLQFVRASHVSVKCLVQVKPCYK